MFLTDGFGDVVVITPVLATRTQNFRRMCMMATAAPDRVNKHGCQRQPEDYSPYRRVSLHGMQQRNRGSILGR
ncbi:MAG TPA: hypothetical protein VJL29_06420 [Thermoguttaceae bacterium]|nr:hypothetical protein [Thermoguttaceae bacterium]